MSARRAKPTLRHKDRVIESVADMLSALRQQVKPKHLIWYRGHARRNWRLVPGLARVPKHLSAENALIKRFMQNAMPHIETPPRDEWEWMFLMQHHRAATRLLDWTESPLAALYFAVYEKPHLNAAGAVWCLDPVALNKTANLRFAFEAEIPAFGRDKVLDSYLPSHVQENPSELFPVAIVGPRNTPRMAAQLGTFTINHRLHTPIDEMGDGRHVWRWIIPGKAKRTILRELGYLGYSALTLFPELDRVADLSRELLDEI
ncbi:MAG: FRG domain-containing protein [Bryobacteraceae bacterium]